jgi:hypothetical protein
LTEPEVPIPRAIKERNPDLPSAMKAVEQFRSGRPVTQRSTVTDEPMEVYENKQIGLLEVVANGKIVYRSRFTPQ